ncbi:MAG: type II toxin-antitoxin system HicA family toxin [Firmicutes bacterium]|nr:type II toxin-antitoxin system HicA family toxin [Bacillota bacterium]
MKSYSSREVIKILKVDGWFEVGCDGDHHQFKHKTKLGKVTVTHPKKDMPLKTLKSISNQSGVEFK